ncbi:MAG TPA: FAD-dependent oxidoreductase [Longimicrobium sp.]|nr:FAD-dependent oxidoreductase [Longimicrobium sp.]
MITDHDIAFPTLTTAQIDALRPRGTLRNVTRGETLWDEGERGMAFFVVLEGEMEVVDPSGDEVRQVAVHRAGEFSGDVDMLSGRTSLVRAHMLGPGQVLELDSDALRRVIREIPEISEVLLRAFLMRRQLLLSDGFRGMQIIGSRFSPQAHAIREFCSRNSIPFTWVDVEQDPLAEELLCRFHVLPEQTPIVVGRGGELLANPSIPELAHYMGLDAQVAEGEVFDLVVVGAGPAGLAAAVYAASEGLRVLTVEGEGVGGQAGTSSRIENYLGFPAGISGPELARNALLQAQKFGARISVPQKAVRLGRQGGLRVVTLDDGSRLVTRCVLVASGAEYRTLGLPNLRQLEGAGVYYAATEMEARLCGGEEVVIVGGGNSAGQAAMYLSRHAARVNVVIRGDDLGKGMSRYLVDRVERTPNITVHQGCQVSGLDGDGTLREVRLRYAGVREEKVIATRALFLFIGAQPRTEWLSGCVELDRHGLVLTGEETRRDGVSVDAWKEAARAPFFLETSLPGVFAAGDVRAGSVKRVASAVGEGSMAVSFVHAHIGAAV